MGIESDQPFTETTIQLEPGDLLLLYTDGITEAMARKPRTVVASYSARNASTHC